MKQLLQVSYWLLTSYLLLIATTRGLATTLVWPDGPDGRLYRIDVQKRTLETETQPNVWQVGGSVQMKNVTADNLPPMTRVTCLPAGDDRFCYLLVDCTQQVYRFDWQTRTLERLDKTFFRGYNCFSAKFVRQGTIYSFGGYGFWHSNNVMTYYKADSHEWESMNPITPAPRSLYRGFNGYLPSNDTFFSALSHYQNDSDNKGAFQWNDSVYAFSFRDKSWRVLGTVSPSVRQHIPVELIQKASWFQVNRYFVLKYHESPQAVFLLVDPVRNEARLWKDMAKLLANADDNDESGIPHGYASADWLYFRRYITGVTNKNEHVVRLSVADLWKQGISLGAFYGPTDSPNSHNWLYGVVVAVLIVGGATAFQLRKPNKPVVKDRQPENTPLGYPHSLTNHERDVFDALLKSTPTGGLNAEQLNEVLALNDKSFENQRKIRADTIKSINLKLSLQWAIDEAIVRVPTTVDRRMHTYQLKPAILERVHIEEEIGKRT